MTCLFDINVLLAITDSHHVFHDPIHRWLNKRHGQTWASCPLTENGFVRILAQPKYASGRRSPAEALETLRQLRNARSLKHVFWPDAVSLAESGLIYPERLVTAKHVTDVYLAALAHSRKARLVTFDTSVAWQAVVGADAGLIEVPGI